MPHAGGLCFDRWLLHAHNSTKTTERKCVREKRRRRKVVEKNGWKKKRGKKKEGKKQRDRDCICCVCVRGGVQFLMVLLHIHTFDGLGERPTRHIHPPAHPKHHNSNHCLLQCEPSRHPLPRFFFVANVFSTSPKKKEEEDAATPFLRTERLVQGARTARAEETANTSARQEARLCIQEREREVQIRHF